MADSTLGPSLREPLAPLLAGFLVGAFDILGPLLGYPVHLGFGESASAVLTRSALDLTFLRSRVLGTLHILLIHASARLGLLGHPYFLRL